MSLRVSAVFVAVLLLAGCADIENCREGNCTPDQRLTAAVATRINAHPALLADLLRVNSEAGTVYLYGKVDTILEYYEAEDIAKATPGVKVVVNMTTINNVRD